MALAAVLSGLEVALPFFAPSVPDRLFGTALALVTVAALIARFVAQRRPPPDDAPPPAPLSPLKAARAAPYDEPGAF